MRLYTATRETADAVIITKDRDFVHIVDRLGTPPKVLWLTMGNTSNQNLKSIVETQLELALELLASDYLVEITGK